MKPEELKPVDHLRLKTQNLMEKEEFGDISLSEA